ncbi:MAG: hypothetical protein HYV32_05165 [Candidatus Kerfeldbacteria bacterium]|nr:hypothetical protein [Candidatus Kerfeldbacteria bacterium]
MDKTAYYLLTSLYNQQWWWVGILFFISALICLYYAYGPKQQPKPLKIWMVVALSWVSIMWLTLVVIRDHMSLIGKLEGAIPAVIVEGFWVAILLFVAGVLLRDILTKNRITFTLPIHLVDKIIAGVFIVISLLYPLYYLPWGLQFPNTAIIGLTIYPTLIFCAVLLVTAMPKSNRWLVLLLLLANTSPLAQLSAGIYENLILVPVIIYLFIKLLTNWKQTKQWQQSLPQ